MRRAVSRCGAAALLIVATAGCGLIAPPAPTSPEETSVAGSGTQTAACQLRTQVSPSTPVDNAPGTIRGTIPGVYANGTHATLLAQPARGWRFAYWEGDVASTDPIIEFVLNRDYSVTAVFVRQLELKVTQIGKGGSVWQLGEGDRSEPVQRLFDVGQTVRLTAETDDGWAFLGWTGVVSGRAATLSVPMDLLLADVGGVIEIQAAFAEIVALSAVTVGQGRIISPDGLFDPAQQISFDAIDSSTMELAAEPNDGSIFWGWQGEIPDGHATSSTLTLTMDRPRAVEAIFAPFNGFRSAFVLGFDIFGAMEFQDKGLSIPGLTYANASLTTHSVKSPDGQETRLFALGWNGLGAPFALVGRVNGDRMDIFPVDSNGIIPLVLVLVQEVLDINLTGRIEANGAMQFGPAFTYDYGFGLVYASGPAMIGLASPLGGARMVELRRTDPNDPTRQIALPGIMVLAVNGNEAKGHLCFDGFDVGDGNTGAVAWEMRGRQVGGQWSFELRTIEVDDGTPVEWITTITPVVQTSGDWEADVLDNATPLLSGDHIVTREAIDPFAFLLELPL